MRYRIAWKHQGSADTIVGRFVFPSLQIAHTVARAMDVAWPEAKHWPLSDEDIIVQPVDCYAAGPLVEVMAEDIEV